MKNLIKITLFTTVFLLLNSSCASYKDNIPVKQRMRYYTDIDSLYTTLESRDNPLKDKTTTNYQ